MSSGMVSFVVPTYNSARTIEKCVKSLISQKVKKEIIVIDDGSTDNTKDILSKYSSKIRYVGVKNRGPASARNKGLKIAKGDYISFIDSDVEVPSGWTERALKRLKERKVAGVGGPGLSRDKGSVSSALNTLLYGDTSENEKYVDSLATMNVVFSSKSLKGMKFDESFTSSSGEDPDFNFRLIKKGFKLLYSPDLKVIHDHPTSLSGILKKWYNYGKHYPLLLSKHPDRKGKEYYTRISFFPILLAFLIISPLMNFTALLAIIQVLLLYLAYFIIGLKAGLGTGTFVFAGIHFLKQLAQLAGTFIGIKKIL